MTIQVITSSYPSHPNDATAAAGLFVRDFACELVRRGHSVVVLVAARKQSYQPDPGITIVPLTWRGGDQELASLDFKKPGNWFIVLSFLITGCRQTLAAARQHHVDRSLCMWVVPAGLFGWWTNRKANISYDVWALGSDIWKIRKLPAGKSVLRKIIMSANRVFADGPQLAKDVEAISGRHCEFLPSSRRLPAPQAGVPRFEPADCTHILFVGRYHVNKGPDILIEAVAKMPEKARERIRVHIFGFGSMKSDLARLIQTHSLDRHVNLHDVVDAQELSNELSRCQYVVIPSRIESIPIVLSDAAQSGVPVIAADVGDLGKLVVQCNAGIVVPSERSDALADGLVRASITSPDIYREGVRQLAAMFDISAICDRWLSYETQREGM